MLTTRAANALPLERLVDLGAERNLAAGADQDHRRLAAFGISHDIGAPRDAGSRREARAVEGRERLAGQHQTGGLMLQTHDDAPGLDDFVGVGRSQRDETGNAAQRDELLDRLVRRTVLPDADRIMREHVDDRKLHQRAQAGWAASCSRKR